MKSKLLAMVAMVSLASVVLADDEASKNELKKFQGKWLLVSLEAEGEKNEIKEENKIVVKDEKVTTQDEQSFSLKLDAKSDPKTIDLTLLTGDEKGKVLEGIYKLKDDELTVCMFGGDGGVKKRPLEFSTKTGSGCLLVVLKRVKE